MKILFAFGLIAFGAGLLYALGARASEATLRDSLTRLLSPSPDRVLNRIVVAVFGTTVRVRSMPPELAPAYQVEVPESHFMVLEQIGIEEASDLVGRIVQERASEFDFVPPSRPPKVSIRVDDRVVGKPRVDRLRAPVPKRRASVDVPTAAYPPPVPVYAKSDRVVGVTDVRRPTRAAVIAPDVPTPTAANRPEVPTPTAANAPAGWLVSSCGDRFPITADEIRVGRRHDAEISLHRQNESWTQAKFIRNGDSVLLVDGDGERPSKNGTFLNSTRVTSAVRLADGDQLYFADRAGTTFEFFLEEPS